MEWESIAGCIEIVKEDKVATLKCIPAVFQNIVNGALLFSGVVALFFIIFSGIKLTLSHGDPKQVEGARHTLTYAILGLLIILFSFAVINLISDILAIPCIKFFGFSNCK
ncbi:MAG: hypothetical protein HYY87_00505 [Candidatus Levybacteria bacterium]|nr:hypothetical protein [Candidatus Levybacteria bacterium]